MKEKRPDLRVFTWIRPYLARWGMYRVLVVDDEKLEREGIRFLLSMEEGEWEIYEAANGKLALIELRSHKIDLMLTDIKMPHMDGLELSKKAREEYEGIFGYDPNGELELEFNEQDEYLAVLLQCIEEKKDMFDVLGGEEA